MKYPNLAAIRQRLEYLKIDRAGRNPFESQPDLNIHLDDVETMLEALEREHASRLTPDSDTHVFFYERDYYVFSNFSAFKLQWKGLIFDTSEAAYQWEKFPDHPTIQTEIHIAWSAHEAYKIAESNRHRVRGDWADVKVGIMRNILRTKVQQHAYVYRKLIATGDRQIVEDSWRDAYWGWGPNRNGINMLGTLWMEIRAELKT